MGLTWPKTCEYHYLLSVCHFNSQKYQKKDEFRKRQSAFTVIFNKNWKNTFHIVQNETNKSNQIAFQTSIITTHEKSTHFTRNIEIRRKKIPQIILLADAQEQLMYFRSNNGGLTNRPFNITNKETKTEMI